MGLSSFLKDTNMNYARYAIEIAPITATFPARQYGLSRGSITLEAGDHGTLRSRAARMANYATKQSGEKHTYCVYVFVDPTGAGIWETTDVFGKGAIVKHIKD